MVPFVRPLSSLALISLAVASATGCSSAASKPAAAPTAASTTPKAPNALVNTQGNLGVSEEILKACKIQFNDVSRAPKFDFEKSDLEPQDRDVLSQVAKCLTSGPLQSASLSLVGRADPRGEEEYNLALGGHRAHSVKAYLLNLGVAPTRIQETSRGKLDATGKDEAGWAQDRRVDLMLK